MYAVSAAISGICHNTPSLHRSPCCPTQDPGHRSTDVVQLPDIDNRMAPAGQLHVNDASWLDAGGLRLVHPGLPDSVAEMLGVKSLRWAGAGLLGGCLPRQQQTACTVCC